MLFCEVKVPKNLSKLGRCFACFHTSNGHSWAFFMVLSYATIAVTQHHDIGLNRAGCLTVAGADGRGTGDASNVNCL